MPRLAIKNLIKNLDNMEKLLIQAAINTLRINKDLLEDLQRGQMWSGIDAEGEEYPEYAEYTIETHKKPSGLPFDRVTLYQTGNLYQAIRAKVSKTSLDITSTSSSFKALERANRYKDNTIFGFNETSVTDGYSGRNSSKSLEEIIQTGFEQELIKLINV